MRKTVIVVDVGTIIFIIVVIRSVAVIVWAVVVWTIVIVLGAVEERVVVVGGEVG